MFVSAPVMSRRDPILRANSSAWAVLFKTLFGSPCVPATIPRMLKPRATRSRSPTGFASFDGLMARRLGSGCFAQKSHGGAGAPESFGLQETGSLRSRPVGCTQSGLLFFGQVGKVMPPPQLP